MLSKALLQYFGNKLSRLRRASLPNDLWHRRTFPSLNVGSGHCVSKTLLFGLLILPPILIPVSVNPSNVASRGSCDVSSPSKISLKEKGIGKHHVVLFELAEGPSGVSDIPVFALNLFFTREGNSCAHECIAQSPQGGEFHVSETHNCTLSRQV